MDNYDKDVDRLVMIALTENDNDWTAIAEFLPGKNNVDAMFRWLEFRVSRKAGWSRPEDEFLANLVKLGPVDW